MLVSCLDIANDYRLLLFVRACFYKILIIAKGI